MLRLGDTMNGAICLICGFVKKSVEQTCEECGHDLRSSDRSLALGLARAALTPEEISEVSERIAKGERPVAPKNGKWTEGAGMGWREWTLIVLGAIAITPLYGLAVSWGWRDERSLASRQALWVSLAILAVELTFLLSWVASA